MESTSAKTKLVRTLLAKPPERAAVLLSVAEMRRRRMLQSEKDYNIAISALGRIGEWRQSLGLLNELHQCRGMNPTVVT